MKYITIATLFIMISMSLSRANDIKPAEIVQTVIIGAGPTLSDSVNECYQRMRNSGLYVVSVSNRNSQNTGSGWVTSIDVKYKIVH